jgi:hypothetical protein
MKSNNDIKELYNQKLNGFLVEEEWKRMIMQIYENEDVVNIENKIMDLIKKKGPTINTLKQEASDKYRLNLIMFSIFYLLHFLILTL